MLIVFWFGNPSVLQNCFLVYLLSLSISYEIPLLISDVPGKHHFFQFQYVSYTTDEDKTFDTLCYGLHY